MKALKLRLYQETVCYKKPYAFKVAETYPLPPYSTIIGFLHNIINAKKYNPMKISVQGNYDGIFTSYNTTRFYHKESITSMPLNVHMLYGVKLVIHVTSDEDVLNEIYEKFRNTGKAFTIGRGEDLARLDEIKFVELNELEFGEEDEDSEVLENYFYVPNFYNTNLSGVFYKINKDYKIINNLRRWNKIDIKYVERGSMLTYGRYYKDDDDMGRDIAFLA